MLTSVLLHAGQTVKRLMVDMSRDSFAHGHTYVALSRTVQRGSMLIYLGEATRPHLQVTNVVYTELLQETNMSCARVEVCGTRVAEPGYYSE